MSTEEPPAHSVSLLLESIHSELLGEVLAPEDLGDRTPGLLELTLNRVEWDADLPEELQELALGLLVVVGLFDGQFGQELVKHRVYVAHHGLRELAHGSTDRLDGGLQAQLLFDQVFLESLRLGHSSLGKSLKAHID